MNALSIYLNNGATSWPKAPGVAESMARFLLEGGANAARGSLSQRDRETLEGLLDLRRKAALAFGVTDPRRVTFTSNVSESLNVLLSGFVKPGMTVVTTSMEHNSVARPLTLLAKRGVSIRKVICSPRGELDLDNFSQSLKGADLAICTHCSNICGTVMPLEEMAACCRNEGVPLAVDGAQTVGHVPIDVESLGLAALCFTGHKGLLGPQGTGGIAWGVDFWKRVDPLMTGGTGSLSESLDQPEVMPDKFETGTANLPGLAGLSAAFDYLATRGAQARERERDQVIRCLDALSALPVRLYGLPIAEGRLPVFAVNAEGVDNAVWAMELSLKGVETRPGLHCSPWGHQTLGTFPQGSLRLSPGPFTTDAELERAFELLGETLDKVKRFL